LERYDHNPFVEKLMTFSGKKNYGVVLVVFLLLASLTLAACGNNGHEDNVDRPIVQSFDRTNTPRPIPPTIDPNTTPYMTATPFPGADPDVVVAEVQNEEITLEEYQAHVRYERWLPLYNLAKNVSDLGLGLLDLTRQENVNTLGLMYLMSDPDSIGYQSMNVMLTNEVVLYEAAIRDIQVEQTRLDGRIAARMDVELGPGGSRPENWDEVYDAFIEEMQLYTGMSERQFLRTMTALALYQQLREIIGEQAPLPDSNFVSEVQVQEAIFEDEESANAAKEALENNQTIQSVAEEYGGSSVVAGFQRTLEADDEAERIGEAARAIVFEARPNSVVGPIEIDEGWYVALVVNQEINILEPAEIEAVREEYYQQWIIEKLDDPDYTVNYEDRWQPYIPLDPMPEDVSPLLRTENFKLPPDPYAGFEEAEAGISISPFEGVE
jgi:hypothetical protein